MKKVLVLLLVLGVASIASATPVLSLSSNTVNVGDSVTLTVTGQAADETGDGGDPVGGGNWYIILDATNYSYGTYGGGGNPYAEFTFPGTKNANAGGGADLSDSYARAYMTAAPPAGSWDEATDVDAGEWFAIAIKGVSEGVTVVDLTTTGLSIIDGSSLALTVVPEPMTIGLLGLGALLLRRRK